MKESSKKEASNKARDITQEGRNDSKTERKERKSSTDGKYK